MQLNSSLHDELDTDAVKARIRHSRAQLAQLAQELGEIAQAKYPQLDLTELQAAIGPTDHKFVEQAGSLLKAA